MALRRRYKTIPLIQAITRQDTRLPLFEFCWISFNPHFCDGASGRPRLYERQGGDGRLLGLGGEVRGEPFLELVDLLYLVLRVLRAGARAGGAGRS